MTVKVRNTDMNSERQKALENAMHQITREFGAGAIMRLGDMKENWIQRLFRQVH